MYTNAAANSAMLQLCLRHDFDYIIFKIKHKLCIDSGSVSPPPSVKFWVHTYRVQHSCTENRGPAGNQDSLWGKTSPHRERVLEVNIYFEASILR
jgi:hypothetical protein